MIEFLPEKKLSEFLVLLAAYQDFYKTKVDIEKARGFFQEFLTKPEEGFVLVAQEKGVLSGFATVHFYRNSLSCDFSAYLHDLYVCPESRGRGLGTDLVKASAKEAQSRGLKSFYWHTHESNNRAKKLYDSLTPQKSTWVSYSWNYQNFKV